MILLLLDSLCLPWLIHKKGFVRVDSEYYRWSRPATQGARRDKNPSIAPGTPPLSHWEEKV